VRSGIFLESTEQAWLAGSLAHWLTAHWQYWQHWQHWLPMAGFCGVRKPWRAQRGRTIDKAPMAQWRTGALALSSCIRGRADGRRAAVQWQALNCALGPTPQQTGPTSATGGPLHQEPGRFGLKRRGPLIRVLARALVWAASLVKVCVSRLGNSPRHTHTHTQTQHHSSRRRCAALPLSQQQQQHHLAPSHSASSTATAPARQHQLAR
jgi:hypothetical protein